MQVSEEQQQSLLLHLRDLRSCLVRSVIALVAAVPIAYLVTDKIFALLQQPVPGLHLIFTGITEMLGVYLKVTLYAAVVIALPFILYQVIWFIHPALTRKEKIYVYTLMPAVLILFIGGVLFAYFILLPPALNFLLTFGGDIAQPMITVDNYISVLARLLFWIGIIFEIPLVMFFLGKIGILNTGVLKQFRPWAYVLAFVLGGVITPTFDPINQTLVAVPVILLYELGTLLVWLTGKKKAKEVQTICS